MNVVFRLSKPHQTAIRVIRRIRYFVSRRKFQVMIFSWINNNNNLFLQSLNQSNCVAEHVKYSAAYFFIFLCIVISRPY